MKNIHVYKNRKNKWCVKKQGLERASFSFDDFDPAEEKAIALAKACNGTYILRENDTEKTTKRIEFSERSGQKNYHVLKQDEFWVVKAEDRKKIKHKFKDRKQAIDMATTAAKNHSSLLIVHKENGDILKIQDLRGIPHSL